MTDIDLEKINQTVNDVTDTVRTIIDTTREAILSGKPKNLPTLYRKTDLQRKGGVAQAAAGFALLGIGALVVAGGALAATGITVELLFSVITGGLMIAAGVPLGVGGSQKVRRIDRFRDYVKVLGKKTFIDLTALSQATGRSVRFLRKDLRDMMEQKMFLQGHFDDGETGLIVSDDTYRDYRRAVVLQSEKESEEAAASAGLEKMSTEGKRIYRLGEDYIAKIRRINDELPGELISEKLQKLEDLIRRILDEVLKKPDKVSDIRKLMNYYLPTTWKLLESYQKLDGEAVKTEQMRKTMADIENTLDTVNEAFENLLDQLFQSEAWDIQSDISVLNTMLRQDSLRDSEFEVNERKEVGSHE